MSQTHLVGIAVPSLNEGGGIPAAGRFLCQVIDDCGSLDYKLFSLPTSASDPASLRLADPKTWFRGPVVQTDEWLGRTFEHVGSVMAEFEFQRYRPRPILTERLRECDLIQVIAGSPAWTLVAREAERPVVLQTATLASVEREARFRGEGGLMIKWRRLMTQLTARFDRRGIGVADRVFVINGWMKDVVAQWTNPEKVMLAPPGVDTEEFRPSRGDSKSDSEYILSVGRFNDRRKNVSLLFEAYASLCARSEDPPLLTLAGQSAPRDDDWRKAENLGIRERIRFHKDVSRERLAELYRGAELFVLSSSEEGLGIVILEAMASGVPVVSTATKGAQEAVEAGATGFLTPTGDAVAMRRAIERVLSNPALARAMGRQGRVRVQQRYSKEVAGERILSVYAELLAR